LALIRNSAWLNEGILSVCGGLILRHLVYNAALATARHFSGTGAKKARGLIE
jgi:hypothetical protein